MFKEFLELAGAIVVHILFYATVFAIPKIDPAYLSPFEDITTVQFFHRVLAVTTFVGVFVFWAASMRVPLAARPRLALFLFAVAVSLQLALGIATLLLFVPVAIAAAHQAGAILLFTMALWVVFELRPSIS